KTEIADRPDPFTADPVRQMPECDLAGNGDEPDQAQRPGRLAGPEARLDQVFGLMHLDRIPREQAAEIGQREPPEPGRRDCPPEGPVDRGPGMIHDVVALLRYRRRGAAIGFETEILRPPTQQQVERSEQPQYGD